MKESLAVTLGRLPSAMWAFIALILTAVALGTIPAIVVVGFIRAGWNVPAGVLGVLALTVILTVLAGVTPVLIVDGAPGFQAVRRSWRLTRRHLGRSVIVLGSMLAVTWGAGVAVALVSRILLKPDGWGAPAGATIAALIGAVTGSILAATGVALHLRLRAASGAPLSDDELAERIVAFDLRRPPLGPSVVETMRSRIAHGGRAPA